jgi:uncharacterized protein YndB with AHSA1/START domain
MSTTTSTAAAATTELVVQLAIRAEPEAVWEGLVDGRTTPAYYVGFTAEFDALEPGADYRYTAGGGAMITGTVVEVDAGRRLTTTFNGLWDPAVAALAESTVTFELLETAMPMPGVTLLRCTHRGLPAGPAAEHLELGWVSILSGLKTLLETGAPMVGAPR